VSKKKPVKAYWWRGNPGNYVSNFGDAITPLLLERFAGLTVEWDTVSHSQVTVTGSILEHIPPLWDGHIIGAGKLYDNSLLHLHTNTAKVWALRGPLTARSVPGDYALGDPGLLADELVRVETRDIDLGIVPHLTDTSLAYDPQWYGPKWNTMVISPTLPPLKVIELIGRCKKIVTSSLHGLITADAFDIPRRYEYNKNATKYEGGAFKFRDYSASIDAPFEPGKLYQASRFKVEDRKFDLYDSFRDMASALQVRAS
jgi:pyruvyltransferase